MASRLLRASATMRVPATPKRATKDAGLRLASWFVCLLSALAASPASAAMQSSTASGETTLEYAIGGVAQRVVARKVEVPPAKCPEAGKAANIPTGQKLCSELSTAQERGGKS